jgi:hypothetical protein
MKNRNPRSRWEWGKESLTHSYLEEALGRDNSKHSGFAFPKFPNIRLEWVRHLNEMKLLC